MASAYKQEGAAIMAVNIEYRAETAEDITGLANCLLKARAVSHMGEYLLGKHITDEFYELVEAFRIIQMFIEPALTFLSDESLRLSNTEIPEEEPENAAQ
jgi:hypothetical protein